MFKRYCSLCRVGALVAAGCFKLDKNELADGFEDAR